MTDGISTLGDGTPSSRRLWRRIRAVALVVVPAGLIGLVGLASMAFGLPPRWVGIVMLVVVIGLAFIWMLMRVLRRLLWRVGRRLAFTYFLVGVLPIPMVCFMAVVATYLLSGFFLGHLFREAVNAVHRDVTLAAEISLSASDLHDPSSSAVSDIAIAYYREGRWSSGDPRAPREWPEWLERRQLEASDPMARPATIPPLVAIDDVGLTLAAAARAGNHGIVAFYDGHLETRLRDISGAWIELVPADDERSDNLNVTILGEKFQLQPLIRDLGESDRQQFLSRGGHDPSFTVQGFGVIDEVLDFATGEVVGEEVSVWLSGTTTFISERLFSSSREIDTQAWLVFVLPAFLLFDVFILAWLMAAMMIVGMSLAVNRLSRATAALQSGDFSVRIPVRRTDQIGALQTSFNQMAEGLERSIESKAQQESLEKELDVARELQKSLIPSELGQGDEFEFATFFEPSAAIGGDYFDIFHLDRRRLAVIIADVSGHGLSAGLHMAMLKASLLILVEEHDDATVILQQLDRVVRTSLEGRLFVTATLALLDLETGRLELTNAGHPPTYIVRGDTVHEVVLPGAPLGAFGHNYGTATWDLEPGDNVVWLSDGFIEATNSEGDLFGYERTLSSLRGDNSTPAMVRDRLLEKVAAHTAGQPAEDDRTLVVMRYLPAGAQAAEPKARSV